MVVKPGFPSRRPESADLAPQPIGFDGRERRFALSLRRRWNEPRVDDRHQQERCHQASQAARQECKQIVTGDSAHRARAKDSRRADNLVVSLGSPSVVLTRSMHPVVLLCHKLTPIGLGIRLHWENAALG